MVEKTVLVQKKMKPGWQLLAEKKKIPEAIVEFIRCFDHVSFVELERRFGEYIEIKGDYVISISPNVFIWINMSQSFVDIIIKLIKDKKIFYYPAHPLTYVADGLCLRLPKAKRVLVKGYKNPHWLPVVFRVISPSEVKKARKRKRAF